MKKIEIPKINKQILYTNTLNNIKYIANINRKRTLCNSSTCIYNNKNINDENRDNYVCNSQINPKYKSIKEIKLNQMKNNQNNKYSYIPISSRGNKKMINNFMFYNNNENKTINQMNNNNNLNSNNMQFIQYSNKANNRNDRSIHKNQISHNYSVSRKIVHPFLDDLNNMNSLNIQNQLYQTPKNVFISKKYENVNKDKKDGKTKYRRIFDQKLNEKINTLDKNCCDSYNNIHQKNNNCKININNRDCITPFINKKYTQKFEKYNSKQSKNIVPRKYINLNTDMNDDIEKIYKEKLNNNYPIDIESKVKTVKQKNSINFKEPKLLFFNSNYDKINDENKKIIKLNSRVNQKDSKELKTKETLQSREVLINDNFDFIDNKSIYLKRYTNYENKRLKNNLFMNHLEISKKLSNNRNIDMDNIIHTDLLENKENIDSNLNNIQVSFINDEEINMMNYEHKLKENQKKKKNKITSSQMNNKNLSFCINNLKKNNMNKKFNLFNNSGIIKNDFTIDNKLKLSEIRNNLNMEIDPYKLHNDQIISFSKIEEDDISKLKVELNEYKNTTSNILNNNNMNNIIQKKKDAKLKSNKINDLKIGVKVNNKNIYQSNTLKINAKDNLISSIKAGKKNNLQIRTKENKENSDKFVKKSSQLNNSNIIQSQQSQTTLNTSKNLYRFPSNTYNSRYSNLEIISEENKCIYSLYYSINNTKKNKRFQISAISFDPEEALFKTKIIEDKNNFYKNFYESVNKVSKANKSIYLMKNEDYYVVTGVNCNKFYQYKFRDNKLEQKSNLKYNHSNGVLISYNEQIICLGGMYSKKVEIFSENNIIWTDLPEMQIERSFFSSCIIKNRFLFVFFGYNYPNQNYLDTIEYFDILNYNINITNQDCQKNNNIYWRYLKYNFFNSTPGNKRLSLIGSIAINYNNEKIIILGGKNCLSNENKRYYQFILEENDMNTNEVNSYIEIIPDKNSDIFGKNYFFSYDYRYIEDLNRNNNMKEPTFAAFDNNYNVHLIKLSTMNHEIFNFKK